MPVNRAQLREKLRLLMRVTPRRAGHTTAILHGAALTEGVVVAATNTDASFLRDKARELGLTVSIVGDLRELRGRAQISPVLLDNHTRDIIFQECLEVLETPNSESEEIIRGLTQHLTMTMDKLLQVKTALSSRKHDPPSSYKALATLLANKIDDLLKDIGIADEEEPSTSFEARKNIRMMLLRRKDVRRYSTWRSLLDAFKEKTDES